MKSTTSRSPLVIYPSICVNFFKLMDLVLILTLDRVFSTTSRSQFVTNMKSDVALLRFTYRVESIALSEGILE